MIGCENEQVYCRKAASEPILSAKNPASLFPLIIVKYAPIIAVSA